MYRHEDQQHGGCIGDNTWVRLYNMIVFVQYSFCEISTQSISCFPTFIWILKEDAAVPPRKPNPDRLAKGPTEFEYPGMTVRPIYEPAAIVSDELHAFIPRYVLKACGMLFINKWLKANKGISMLDMITVCDLAYAITIIKNHVREGSLDGDSCREWAV